MPVSAATLRKLMDAGLEGESLLDIVASIDADMAAPVKKRSAGAIRQQRYRERHDLTASEWAEISEQIKERDNYTCGYCGSRLAPLHVDHIIPLVQGGTSEGGNLITACMLCNTAKSGRTPEQWGRPLCQ